MKQAAIKAAFLYGTVIDYGTIFIRQNPSIDTSNASFESSDVIFKLNSNIWEFEEMRPELEKPEPTGNSKYDRTIIGKFGTGSCTIDVYRVLHSFEVTNPQLQHLVKKALAVGKRGHKDTRQDLVDILHSAQSALDMFDDIKEKKNV